jgi:hypothetical protein
LRIYNRFADHVISVKAIRRWTTVVDSQYELFYNDLHRIADALTRLADHFCPIVKKEHKPSHLGVACYSEEERERLNLKNALKRKAPQPPE